jgi:hypothetical protein
MPATITQAGMNNIQAQSASSFTIAQQYERLSPENKDLYNLYKSLHYIGDFIHLSWTYKELHTSAARALIARLCKSADKGMSSLNLQLPTTLSILCDISLASIQQLVRDLEWYMILNRYNAPYSSAIRGGLDITLTTDGFFVLAEFEKWSLLENAINSDYSAPFNVDLYLSRLFQGLVVTLPFAESNK